MRSLAGLILCLGAGLAAATSDDAPEARSVPVATIPHVAAGGGWKTTIRIPNPSKQIHEVRLETYRANGAAMATEINGRSSYSQTFTVAPQGLLDLVLAKEGTVEDGYAFLMFLTGASLPHVVLYESNGIAVGAVGKAAGAQYQSEYFQFDNTSGATTGLAFLVPVTTSDVQHRVTCYADGAILGSYTFPVTGVRPLPPGGYQKLILAAPGNLSSTESLKGMCYFSIASAGVSEEKTVARPVISLRFGKQGFLPLTY